MPFTGIAAAGLGALANIGGGLFSAAGAAGMNAQQMQMQNMYNQQMLNAQMAQHAQQTGFQEDAQAHDIFVRNMGNQWSERQAEKQMWFQREMFEKAVGLSNTEYQRTMADMKKAGLNPMLAYQQGGASAPSAPGGAMGAPGGGSSIGASGGSGVPSLRTADQVNPNSELGRALGNLVSNATDTMKTIQGVDLMKKQTATEDWRTDTEMHTAAKRRDERFQVNAQTDVTKQQEKNLKVEEEILRANANTARENSRIARADAEASERYGGKYAPGTIERMARQLQDATERGGGVSMWDILHRMRQRHAPGAP